jgi:hypothetical protein
MKGYLLGAKVVKRLKLLETVAVLAKNRAGK